MSGTGASTGAYSFRLLDTASAVPFNLGDDVGIGVDEPGGAALYSFTAQAGDTVSLNVAGTSGSGTWQLRDPFGRVVFGPQGIYTQTGLALAATGTYVLVVDDGVNGDGSTTVQLASSLDSHTDPAPLTGTPVSFGSSVSGTIDSAGDADLYTFTASAGQRLHFVAQSQDGNPSYTITGPRGTELSASFFNDNTPAIDLPLAGTYQIAITNYADTSYAFQLDDLGTAAALATDGTAATGTIDSQFGSTAYSFAGTAGSKLLLNASADNGLTYVLLDPADNVVERSYLQNTVLSLAGSGTYTLLLEGVGYQSGNADYSLSLTPIANPVTQPLTLGQRRERHCAAYHG